MKTHRRKFTPEEDSRLKQLVHEFGAHKWDRIAEGMPGRSGRQCRDRYQNYLCPGIMNDEWTTHEEMLLKKLYDEYGPRWSKISSFFQGRTGTALKNRWNYYVSRGLAKAPAPEPPVVKQPAISSANEEKGVAKTEDRQSAIEQTFGQGLSDCDKFKISLMEIGDMTDIFGTDDSLFF